MADSTAPRFKRSWSASRNFIQVPVEAIKELGGTDALILTRIEWRCDAHDNAWEATLDTIATETGFSKRTVGDSTRRLREKGYIDAERGRGWDATMVWSVRYDDEDPVRNLPRGDTESATSGVRNVPSPPIRRRDKSKTNTASAAPPVDVLSAFADTIRALVVEVDDEEAARLFEAMKQDGKRHPAKFIESLIEVHGEHAARGYIESLGVGVV